jgi:hypothetical protein
MPAIAVCCAGIKVHGVSGREERLLLVHDHREFATQNID